MEIFNIFIEVHTQCFIAYGYFTIDLSFNQFICKKISFYSTDSSSNIDKQYKQAEQIKPKYILFFGDEEIKSNTYTIKDSRDKVKKEKISKNELIKIFDKINK